MGISASVTNQQITASVGETQIDVAVSGGVGPTGTAGAAATITVGTVTTGAAGSSASVVNAGSSSAAVLNFTIPAGATGATGAQGATGATGPAGTTTWAGITDKPSTFTPASHVHGNLTNAGAIGTTSGQIVVTTTGGALTTAAYALGNQVLLYSGQTSAALTGSLADFLVPIGAQGMGLVDIVDYLGAAQATHTHAASDIASGTIATARLATGTASASTYLRGDQTWATITSYTLPNATTSTLGGVIVGTGLSVTSGTVSVSYGTTSGTACQGNDSRLSDSRSPTSHASSHASGGSDAVSLAASQITSGTVATARLGSGTANSTTYLRGDQTWATVSGESFHPFLLGGM